MVIIEGNGNCPKCGIFGAIVITGMNDVIDATRDQILYTTTICSNKECGYLFGVGHRMTYRELQKLGAYGDGKEKDEAPVV